MDVSQGVSPVCSQVSLLSGATSHLDKVEKIFKQQGIDSSSWGMWRGFCVNNGMQQSITGYEDSKKQWKLFLNPTRENFYTVLDRMLKVLKTTNIPLVGKIADDVARKSKKSALDDPNEPKLLLYIVGQNEEEANRYFQAIISSLEHEFTPQEMESFSCGEGSRKRDGQDVSQWGPSFTKKRSNLIFYTQGGYVESGRNTIAESNGNTLDKQRQFCEKFEGENYYLIKGCKDPVLESAIPAGPSIPPPREEVDSAGPAPLHAIDLWHQSRKDPKKKGYLRVKEGALHFISSDQMGFWNRILRWFGCGGFRLLHDVGKFVTENKNDFENKKIFLDFINQRSNLKRRFESIISNFLVKSGVERILRFVDNRLQNLRKIKEQSKDLLFYKWYDTSIQKKEAATRVSLQRSEKDAVSDLEVAIIHDMSIEEYQVQKLAEGWFSICRDAVIKGDSLPKFSEQKLAAFLCISEEEVRKRLIQGEELVALQETLSTFSSQISLEASGQEVVLQNMTTMIKGLEKYLASFSKPLDILKIYNVWALLEKLTMSSTTNLSLDQKQRIISLKEQVKKIFSSVLQKMNLKRQGAVWELMSGANISADLHQQVGSILWGVTDPYGEEMEVKDFSSLRPEVGIKTILEKTDQLLKQLNDALSQQSPVIDEELLEKFPKVLQGFYKQSPDSAKDTIELMKKKLESVKQRQEARQKLLSSGGVVELPMFFHAARNEQTLFAVATTGI